MSRIIDLSVPIRDHFRWPVERSVQGDFTKGDLFQVTRLGWSVHGFTHMDSPRHFFADGETTSQISLEATVGDAVVLDLADIRPNQPIDAALLAERGAAIEDGGIVLFKTCWDRQRSLDDEAFWRDAPYLTRDGCEWLLAQAPKAVAFDFPQDHSIRDLLDGIVRPLEEHVSHDVLLRNGVILIEYLANTAAISRDRVWFCCLPLKIEDSDGAPARVICIED